MTNNTEELNLISVIYEQMTTDDGADQNQSDRLERLYNEATPYGKFIIDEVLMTICGWCFETIKTNNFNNKAGA